MAAQHPGHERRLRGSDGLARHACAAGLRQGGPHGRLTRMATRPAASLPPAAKNPDRPQQALAELRTRMQARRTEAVQAWRVHLRPDTLLSALRRIADETLRGLLKIHPLPSGACAAAVGGYGRGELYPGSDLDILILLERAPDTADRERIEALVAALWDIGLEPGLSVRTLEQCRQEAAADRSEEHTSELQSREKLVCRLLLEKLNKETSK